MPFAKRLPTFGFEPSPKLLPSRPPVCFVTLVIALPILLPAFLSMPPSLGEVLSADISFEVNGAVTGLDL